MLDQLNTLSDRILTDIENKLPVSSKGSTHTQLGTITRFTANEHEWVLSATKAGLSLQRQPNGDDKTRMWPIAVDLQLVFDPVFYVQIRKDIYAAMQI